MTLLIYSLLAGAILSALWVTYRMCGMHGLTHFRLNRVLLVGILLVASILPFIAFRSCPEVDSAPAQILYDSVVTVPMVESDSVSVLSQESLFDWSIVWHYAEYVYFAGLIITILWLMVGLGTVLSTILSGKNMGNGIVIHRRNLASFTWGRWLIISENDCDNNAILLHERAHLNAYHWLDLLLCRIISCICWYWPTAWLINRNLQEVHEFEADYESVNSGIDSVAYQRMLVNSSVALQFANLVNPFNYNALKKRILMMKKKESSKSSRLRGFFLVPMLAVVSLLIASPALARKISDMIPATLNSSEQQSNSRPTIWTINGNSVIPQFDITIDDILGENACKNLAAAFAGLDTLCIQDVKIGRIRRTINDYDSINIILGNSPLTSVPADVDNPVFEKPDVAPQFPGGDANLYKWISSNMRYPAEAMEKNIQGRVVLQFVVKSDGSIGDIKVVREVSPLLSEEAIRMVRQMPKFDSATVGGKAVNAWYTLPFNFKLQKKESSEASSSQSAEVIDLDPKDVVAAVYPGGSEAMYEFLTAQINPEKFVSDDASNARAVMAVTIEKDGTVSNVIVNNNTGGKDFAAEAIRVFKLLKFKPATYKGEPKKMWLNIPFEYTVG